MDPRRPEKIQRYKPPPANNNAAPGDDLTPDYMNILDTQRKTVRTESRTDRFKIVKVETMKPFARGRWLCMDFLDQSYTNIIQHNTSKSNDTKNTSSSRSEPREDTNPVNWEINSEVQNAMLHIFHRQNSSDNLETQELLESCLKRDLGKCLELKNYILMPGLASASLNGIKFPLELNLIVDTGEVKPALCQTDCVINLQMGNAVENTTDCSTPNKSTGMSNEEHVIKQFNLMNQASCVPETSQTSYYASNQIEYLNNMSNEQTHFAQTVDKPQITSKDSGYQLHSDIYNPTVPIINPVVPNTLNNGSQYVIAKDCNCIQCIQGQSVYVHDKMENIPEQANVMYQNIPSPQQFTTNQTYVIESASQYTQIASQNIIPNTYKEEIHSSIQHAPPVLNVDQNLNTGNTGYQNYEPLKQSPSFESPNRNFAPNQAEGVAIKVDSCTPVYSQTNTFQPTQNAPVNYGSQNAPYSPQERPQKVYVNEETSFNSEKKVFIDSAFADNKNTVKKSNSEFSQHLAQQMVYVPVLRQNIATNTNICLAPLILNPEVSLNLNTHLSCRNGNNSLHISAPSNENLIDSHVSNENVGHLKPVSNKSFESCNQNLSSYSEIFKTEDIIYANAKNVQTDNQDNAIDTKIDTLMDNVRKDIKFAVSEDMHTLKQRILLLKERIVHLEHENGFLKRRLEEFTH